VEALRHLARVSLSLIIRGRCVHCCLILGIVLQMLGYPAYLIVRNDSVHAAMKMCKCINAIWHLRSISLENIHTSSEH
jgi:hypothetical protein